MLEGLALRRSGEGKHSDKDSTLSQLGLDSLAVMKYRSLLVA
jgi:hypothetical protein